MQMILPAARDTPGRIPRRIISRAASRAHRNMPVRFTREHGVPLLERHLGERRVRLDPRVVDEDVDPAPRADHLAEHGLDLVLARDVGAHRHGPHAAGGDFGGDARRRVGLDM